MSLLTTKCCRAFPDGTCCDEPVRYYALCARAPQDWGPGAAGASLGGYCSLVHANAEPRPTLADAQRNYRAVADPAGAAVWEQLLDVFPEPISAPVLDPGELDDAIRRLKGDEQSGAP